ncbi:MAG: class III extradiol ring-cleavage dioxygenase [Cyclobacteriaceae bacterium]
MSNLHKFKSFTDTLPAQGVRMPVLFTSHGSPMDIPLSREERPFWKALHTLGRQLESQHEVKAVLVVSAHWCTRGTYVNIASDQEQIYDYYGFPEEYYRVQYHAKGAPDVAHEVTKLIPSVQETPEWGLDHGAWPMLMHLFPEGNVPVFQMSIDYYARPEHHFELGRQLHSLRQKGVLVIGSGSLIHNLPLAMQKMQRRDMTPYGWEADYDQWIKGKLDTRDVQALIQYETSHPLGKIAAPTPDHYVPVLYSLGMMDKADELHYFYELGAGLPAFSERSFWLG